ncbi:MAG TPA: sugar phosphate isomerase/epimerase [Gemmatimonadales bacterium]|nr:sugar phosphate isomerase/epimerase [Gemmatimonadales bacterium]
MPSDRREFLGAAAGGVAALALGRRWPPAYDQLGPIGIQLYTVRDRMKTDFEGTLGRIAKIGYQEVEFAGYFDHTPAQVRNALKTSGLTAPSAHVEYTRIVKGEWDKVVEESLAVGHQYAVVAWIDEDQRKTLDGWKRVADRLSEAAHAAKKAGLGMAYHNHSYEFEPLEGQVPYDVLLSATDPSVVKLEMDLYWVTRGGRDPLEYFARWPGRIRLVHIKDSKGPPQHVMADVGTGVIPWGKIFAKHKQAGIEHYFVEHDEPKDGLASAEVSYRYLRQLRF